MIDWITRRVQQLGWSISLKLRVCFGLILLLFVLSGVVVVSIQVIVIDLNNRSERKSQLVYQIQNLQKLLNSQQDVYTNEILLHDVPSLTLNDTVSNNLAKSLFEVSRQPELLGPLGTALFKTFASKYSLAIDSLSGLRQAISPANIVNLRKQLPQFLAPHYQAQISLDELYRQQNEELLSLQNSRTSFLQITLIATLVGSLICLLVGLVLASLFTQSITRPLRQIQTFLDQVAVGDLSGQIKVENRDELGRLSQALDLAITNLRQVISGVGVGQHLQELVHRLNVSSQQQALNSNVQLSSVSEIGVTMQHLAQRSEQISHNASTVASTTEHTAHLVSDLKHVAEQANTIAKRVNLAVATTVQNISQVNSTTETLNVELEELTLKARQIEQVVHLIGNIAGQVHLLALNAAIEAVGAAQYGKRFRAVAAEIKQLALTTSQNAGEISGLVSQVQAAIEGVREQAFSNQKLTETVVVANQNLIMVAGEIEEVIGKTVVIADEIYAVANQVDQQAEEIKQATQEQMTASLQITGTLHNISQMAGQNVDSSGSIVNTTNQLNEISSSLVQILSGINLA